MAVWDLGETEAKSSVSQSAAQDICIKLSRRAYLKVHFKQFLLVMLLHIQAWDQLVKYVKEFLWENTGHVKKIWSSIWDKEEWKAKAHFMNYRICTKWSASQEGQGFCVL